MLVEYINAALRRGKYEILPNNEGYYGMIEGFDGVWSNADTLEGCREELREVLEDWILVRTKHQLPIPVVENIDLNVREVAEV